MTKKIVRNLKSIKTNLVVKEKIPCPKQTNPIPTPVYRISGTWLLPSLMGVGGGKIPITGSPF